MKALLVDHQEKKPSDSFTKFNEYEPQNIATDSIDAISQKVSSLEDKLDRLERMVMDSMVMDRDPYRSHVVDRDPDRSHVVDRDPDRSHVMDRDPYRSHVVDRDPYRSHVVDRDPDRSHVVDTDPYRSHVVDRDLDRSHVVDRDPYRSHVMDLADRMEQPQGLAHSAADLYDTSESLQEVDREGSSVEDKDGSAGDLLAKQTDSTNKGKHRGSLEKGKHQGSSEKDKSRQNLRSPKKERTDHSETKPSKKKRQESSKARSQKEEIPEASKERKCECEQDTPVVAVFEEEYTESVQLAGISEEQGPSKEDLQIANSFLKNLALSVNDQLSHVRKKIFSLDNELKRISREVKYALSNASVTGMNQLVSTLSFLI
jgi:hypothetical protein